MKNVNGAEGVGQQLFQITVIIQMTLIIHFNRMSSRNNEVFVITD